MTPSRSSRAASSARPLLVIVAVIVAMYLARQVLIPFAFALTLAFLLAPPVYALQKLHLPRFAAVLIAMTLTMAVVGGVGWAVADQLVTVAGDLPKYRQNIRNKIQSFHLPTKGVLAQATENVKQIGKELSAPPAPSAPARTKGRQAPAGPAEVQVVETENTGLSYVRELITPILGPVAEVGVVLVFAIFMLIKREDLRNRLIRLAGVGRLNVMTQALEDAAARVSRYLLLQVVVNAAFGVAFGAGLFFIGVPSALLWGLVAAIFRIVPYAGALIAASFPFLLSLAVFDGWLPPVLVLLLYSVLELALGSFLEPWLYGAHTGISSLAMLVTSVFWTVLWGLPGLILSTPLTVCVVVLGRYIPQLGFLHILLGEEAVLAPEEQLYQRLLALDHQEARDVADDFLKDHSLAELYETVFLPALGLAEMDRHKGALDPSREEYLFLNMNEMIAEYAEHVDVQKSDPPDEEMVLIATNEPPLRAATDLRVLCLAARDEADGISAAMLAQVLERAGFPTICLPVGIPLGEVQNLLQANSRDAICICAVPPLAFAHSRTLYKQLSVQVPGVAAIVAIWGMRGDLSRAKTHFDRGSTDTLATNFEDVLKSLNQIRATANPEVAAV